MKRIYGALLTVLLVALAMVVAVSAAQPTIVEDASVDLNNPDTNYGTDGTITAASTFPACTITNRVFLKIDLSAVADGTTIDSVDLTFNVTNASGDGNIQLYPVSDDTWSEGSITWNNQPALGAPIETTAIAGGTGTFTISGASGGAFASYLETEKNGDNTASIAMDITGCTGPVSIMASDSTEGTTPPTIAAFDPTAVELTGVSTGVDSSPYLWIFGSVLLLLLFGGASMLRKKSVR